MVASWPWVVHREVIRSQLTCRVCSSHGHPIDMKRYLTSNNLTTLPDGTFEGLTTLTTL